MKKEQKRWRKECRKRRITSEEVEEYLNRVGSPGQWERDYRIMMRMRLRQRKKEMSDG